jgi:hypothetical protein
MDLYTISSPGVSSLVLYVYPRKRLWDDKIGGRLDGLHWAAFLVAHDKRFVFAMDISNHDLEFTR